MDARVDAAQLQAWGLGVADAADLAEAINRRLAAAPDAASAWTALTRDLLTPDQPFALHAGLYRMLGQHWPSERGPLPAWTPGEADVARANATALQQELGLDDYESLRLWSRHDRQGYWTRVVQRVDVVFQKPYALLMDLSTGAEHPSWFLGAKMNIVDSCFKASPEALAVVYRRREGEPLVRWTYGALERLANRVANGLFKAGFTPGDAIAVDMPMTVESVAIYLGIVKAGCVAISIADSFSPREIAVRLRIGKAKGVFTMDFLSRGGKQLPLYRKVVDAGAPRTIVLPNDEASTPPLRNGDMTWSDFLSERDHFDAVIRDPHDVVNILFSSGTTGEPKAIPWNHATPLKAAADAMFHHDVHPGDVLVWPTNLGWMMGPWLIFAALLNRATIGLYGDAPTTRGFCAFVQDAGATMLGVVPSLVKAWRHNDATAGLDWTGIRCFSSTGECSNPEDMLFLMSRAGYRPVIEYIGGTEIGGGFLAGTLVQPAIPSTFATTALGLDVVLLDENDRPADEGELYVVPPSIGLSLTLLNRDHHQVYYAGAPRGPNGELLRRHGDRMARLLNGYWRAHGRADDTMNLGGVKVGSAEIERALKGLPGLDEAAAVALEPPDGGPSQLAIFATVSGDAPPQDAMLKAMRQAIKTKLNPLFKIEALHIVDTLPRTASGKVMRRLLRQRATDS